jgi:hypothetical protein
MATAGHGLASGKGVREVARQVGISTASVDIVRAALRGVALGVFHLGLQPRLVKIEDVPTGYVRRLFIFPEAALGFEVGVQSRVHPVVSSRPARQMNPKT